MVGCQGVVQLGGPDPWFNRGGPAKVGQLKSFLFTGSSLEVKITNTRLIFFLCRKSSKFKNSGGTMV